jgi:sodium transport system permease protein
MRWSIVRVIWLRELRDQLRDRRTIFMIAVLPILLYPLIGLGMMQLAIGLLGRSNVIGVIGADPLLARPSLPQAALVLPWLQVPGNPPGAPLAGLAQVVAATASNQVLVRQVDFPPFLLVSGDGYQIAPNFFDFPTEASNFEIQLLPQRPSNWARPLEGLDRSALDNKQVDVQLVVPPWFRQELEQGGRPTLWIQTRENDDHSRLVQGRLTTLLGRWKGDLKQVRMLRQGLPADYDDAFAIWDPDQAKPSGKRLSDDLFKVLSQIFPFVLVMWSLAGALYPAVDLCAGEKERGTMETLLISPASREEIVWGKFLTIWVFSAATALLNLISMGLTAWQFSQRMIHSPFQLGSLFWGVLLLLPLSAFFSALCLSVGVYARSSKEGQYYLMPLFLMTLPLIFLTLVPGVELNPFYSMVPVTGVALLLQSLMAAGSSVSSHVLYFIPVLAPMVIYSWLALRWAIEQFQREEVLFREAERLELRLWLRNLFRDKEALPSTGQALFCFGLILALRWLSFNIGADLSLLVRTGISHLAFVATPPLFMALLLTTRPRAGLGLEVPPWWAWPVAVVLGLLVVPPISELTLVILGQFPALRQLLEQYHPLTTELQSLLGGDSTSLGNRLQYLLVLGLLPALCEELAFRGFILFGLLRRFRPWTAIFLSSFLFSLYQMNVFQSVPHFVFGCILAFLVLRTGSVLPAMVFHLVYNILVLIPVIFPEPFQRLVGVGEMAAGLSWFRVGLALFCTLLTLVVLAVMAILGRKQGHPAWNLPTEEMGPHCSEKNASLSVPG